jgi:hypothetical protein
MQPWFKAAVTALLLAAVPAAAAAALDHTHAAWTALLERHVEWVPDGTTTVVDYAGFADDRRALQTYLDELATPDMRSFEAWTTGQRMAFLINAYNAWTVALILERYPDLRSIRQIGGLFLSPWSRKLAPLLGSVRTLDEIEHEMLRSAPWFDEPRIHFAVNCASIGCPALRPEAFVAAELDAQLEDQTLRFLRDRTRNTFDSSRGRLSVSPIFRWYPEDFPGGPPLFLSQYADVITDTPEDAARVRTGDYRLQYTRYVWSLNEKSL